MWTPVGRIVVATALIAGACGHGAKGDGAPRNIGNASTGDGNQSDAGVPDAAEPPPANPDEAWLYEVRSQFRAMKLDRCALANGGLDVVCFCNDACALALPKPPSAGKRVVDWSDGLKLDVADDGRIVSCQARATVTSAWATFACPRTGP